MRKKVFKGLFKMEKNRCSNRCSTRLTNILINVSLNISKIGVKELKTNFLKLSKTIRIRDEKIKIIDRGKARKEFQRNSIKIHFISPCQLGSRICFKLFKCFSSSEQKIFFSTVMYWKVSKRITLWIITFCTVDDNKECIKNMVQQRSYFYEI